MNWKVATGLISAIAALITVIASFNKKDAPTTSFTASGNQNIQIQGSGNTITAPSQLSKKVSIPFFKGQLKEDNNELASYKLAKQFNTFINENENKIVKLDVFNYYTHEDWNSSDKNGMKALSGGFPDPRYFRLAEECPNGYCSGYEYEINGNLDQITFNPGTSARFIRGYFRIKIIAARQGWIFVNLKPVSDEHIDIISQ